MLANLYFHLINKYKSKKNEVTCDEDYWPSIIKRRIATNRTRYDFIYFVFIWFFYLFHKISVTKRKWHAFKIFCGTLAPIPLLFCWWPADAVHHRLLYVVWCLTFTRFCVAFQSNFFIHLNQFFKFNKKKQKQMNSKCIIAVKEVKYWHPKNTENRLIWLPIIGQLVK